VKRQGAAVAALTGGRWLFRLRPVIRGLQGLF